jgi:hypothetical protein
LSQVFLVEFGEHNNGDKTLHEIENTHHSYLLLVKETEEEARVSLLYSYKHTFNGFAELLTPNEANNLSGKVLLLCNFMLQLTNYLKI